jgi:DNA replication protein DnaC
MDELKDLIDEIPGEFGDKLREARDRNNAENEKYGIEEATRRRGERQRIQQDAEDAEKIRIKSIEALEKSGLKDAIKECTFATFEINHDWQRPMIELCRKFIAQDEFKFLYLSGQPGCGKTHLGTAVCGHFINAGRSTVYGIHSAMLIKLKAHVNDDCYEDVQQKYTSPYALYIDDFFKPAEEERNGKKTKLPPTGADIRHTFDFINMRVVQRKVTIITSEWSLDEIIRIDEALGSRIKQKAGKFVLDIERKEGRNWRLK